MHTDELYDNEFKELIKRFENNIDENAGYFFDTEDLIDIIDHYFNEGDAEMARKALDVGLTFSPENTELKLREAQWLAAENEIDEALNLLEKLEAIEPNNPEIFFTKGTVYSVQNKSEQAIDEYNKAMMVDTEDLEDIYMNIAFEYENLGNFDKAIEFMKKVLEINPAHDYVPADLSLFFDLGNRSEEGIEYLKDRIDNEPFAKGLWLGLGMLYRSKGRHDEALNCFDYVIAIDESDLNGWFHKATAYLLAKKYAAALTCYQRILDVAPDEVATLFNMAECYERMKEHEKAQEYLRKVLKLESDSSQATIALTMSFYNQGEKNKAYSVLEEAIKRNPDVAEFHAALGELYCENKDFEKGLPHVFRAVEITKDQPEFIATVCYAMVDAGLQNEALNFIESKMVQNEDYPRLILIRGIVNLKTNRKEAALNDLLVAFVIDPSNVSWFKDHHPEMLEYPEIHQILQTLN